MNSNDIFEVIERVAATSSKLEKEAILKQHIADKDLQRTLVAALDPLITYGIQKVPNVSGEGDGVFSESTWFLLADLSTRELSGDAALAAVEKTMLSLTSQSAELLRRVIRKDLRAGFAASTANKAKRGLIKTFPYERCSLPNKVDIASWDWKHGIISQEKADGMYVNVNHFQNGDVEILSRQGSPFPLSAMSSLVEEVKSRLTVDTQTQGELLVCRALKILSREKSNGVMNRILNGGALEDGEEIIFMVWNQLPLAVAKPKGKFDREYRHRLQDLIVQLRRTNGNMISVIPTRMCYSLEEAYLHCAELLEQGKEGTIIKQLEGTWRDGTAKHQVKLKLEVDVDLVVTEIQPGREGTKNEGRAGALSCETSCGALKVDVAVKNEAMRAQVDAQPDEWIGKVIAVRANAILRPSESSEFHSLFLPRMVEATYRTDKSEPDSLEQVRDQFASAVTNIVTQLEKAA